MLSEIEGYSDTFEGMYKYVVFMLYIYILTIQS